MKQIRNLQNEALDVAGQPEDEKEFVLEVPERFSNNRAELTRSMLLERARAPAHMFPPAAPATTMLLSQITDHTVNAGATAPQGGRTSGSRARGSDDSADDDDMPDELRPRSKARSSPSHFR